MEEYPIEFFDNHIITHIDGKSILIDTGSPFSLGDCRSIQLLGNNYSLYSKCLNFSIDDISELLGKKVNVLLGGDILRDIYFYINCDKKIIQFSSEPLSINGEQILIVLENNVPTLDLQINGNNFKAFLDTGAKISYIDPEITSNYKSIGRANDFYPGLGRFETNIYEVPITLGSYSFTIVAGNLPDILQMLSFILNSKVFLGNDIFKFFNVYFSYRDKKIVLVKKIQH